MLLNKPQGQGSWAVALGDISHFVAHAATLNPTVPLYLFGHSMGGGLSLAFATRTPPSPGLDNIKGVLASAPLLRQSPGVKAPALVVRAGSILGAIAPSLSLKTVVAPAVRRTSVHTC